MKICFLHKSAFQMPRGIETLIVSLANELAALGDDVTIVTVRGKLTPSASITGPVRAVSHPNLHYFETNSLVPFYLSSLTATSFDLVVIFSADFGETNAPALRRLLRNQPFIIYLCYPLSYAPQRYLAMKQMEIADHAAAIVADADYIAEAASNYFGRVVEVIPPGINPVRCYPSITTGLELRRDLGISSRTKVLLTVAPLDEREGIQRVLRAMPLLLRHQPDLEYVVVGRGPDEQKLQALTCSLHLERQVRFMGTVPNLLPYYNMADLFVLLSKNKGLSVACLEAMACAKPVVVGSYGPFIEAVPHHAGYRVPLDDEEQLADVITNLLRNPLAAQIGAQARQHVLRYYTWTTRALELRQLCASFSIKQKAALAQPIRGGTRIVRICFLHKFIYQMPRGIETLVVSLANELTALGDEVTIVTARGNVAPNVAINEQVKVIAHPRSRYFEARMLAPFYLSTLATRHFDMVIIFFADYGEATSLHMLRLLRDQPFLIYLCYPLDSTLPRYQSFKQTGLATRAQRIIADSGYIASGAEDFFGREVAIIPPGISPLLRYPAPDMGNRLREQLGLRQSSKVLLNVAALERGKGIQRVLHALPPVLHEIPDLQYVVLGQGDYEAELRRLTAELGLDDVVRFAGTTPDLLPYYNMADLFVLMSENEGLSVACLEAMACARPVLVADDGGFRESVPPGTGVRVPLGDNAALARAIVDTLRSYHTAEMAMQARRWVLANYTWQARARQLHQLIAAPQLVTAQIPSSPAGRGLG